jgi:Carboxypeptidase regulatory-like domain
MDAGADSPLSGARVEIVEKPAAFERALALKAMRHGARWQSMADRPDRTQTAADGLFYFLDLPDGAYTLEVSVSDRGARYGAERAAAKVARDQKGNIQLEFLEIPVQPTTVRGKITAAGHRKGISMAEVRVQGSGESTFTGADGGYVLRGVEPGRRTILASARGYRQDSRIATIKRPGDVVIADLALAPDVAESAPSGGPKQ